MMALIPNTALPNVFTSMTRQFYCLIGFYGKGETENGESYEQNGIRACDK